MTTETDSARGHWKELAISYEDALARLPGALEKEGFGILTQIDMQATLKAKLGVDFRRYRIFGACNPPLAHAAVLADPKIGVHLPCNIVLYEADGGRVVMGTVDPMQVLGGASGHGNPALQDIAREVGQRLDRVLAELAA